MKPIIQFQTSFADYQNLTISTNPAVELVFDQYPDHVREKLLHLRNSVIETAHELEEVTALEETLKWGEPSYLVKGGSTIRMDWKAKKPDQYAMYFKCTTLLVPTFREVYADLFRYEGDRALVFDFAHPIPGQPLKNCIAAALTYHHVKKLPLLGMAL